MHVVVIAVLSLISCVCAQEDQVRMTLLSVNHYQSQVDGNYQCHLSDPDMTDATVTSFRKVYTRNNGKSKNPDPPDPEYQGSSYYKIPLDDSGDDEWFGVLGCRASRNGRMEAEISTTRMRSDAYYVPTNKLFTQTVNVGDTDVGITMESLTGESIADIRWRKDNSGLRQSGSDTFRIDGPVELSDAGVYESHYQGKRNEARQGLNILLVRACQANRWGPPDCNGICDSCYNGGICNENNGKCVCPPGFKGDNCLTGVLGHKRVKGANKEARSFVRNLVSGDSVSFRIDGTVTRGEVVEVDRFRQEVKVIPDDEGQQLTIPSSVLYLDHNGDGKPHRKQLKRRHPPQKQTEKSTVACGGNSYGYDCEIECLQSGDDDSCEGLLFCLIHPYGCRCNTGWKGLACKTACNASTFGASCLQSCNHCSSGQCDRYTGRCTGPDTSCKPGWTGENCQECDGNYFGTDCTQECHCYKESCNRETGLCKPGGCLPQWVDRFPPYSCQTGLVNITYTKMNPGIPVPVTCEAEEGPGDDLGSLELVLSKDSEHLVNGNITDGERSVDGTTRNFAVTNVGGGDILHCQLRSSSSKLAVLNLSVEVFVLPELTSAPEYDSVDVTSVTIRWLAWDEGVDFGDPPLVGYIPYHKKAQNNSWIPSIMVSPQTLIFRFNSLDPDSSYSFSVSAVREGEGGEGPKSPELSVRTVCSVPPSPEDVTAEISGERQELVRVSWQLPSQGITCSSGVFKFTVYYSSSESDLTSVDVPDHAARSVTLYDLTPGVTYSVYVTVSTSGGESSQSNRINHLVPVLPSLTNPPSLINITCSSVTMVWSEWNEERDDGTPPIIHYTPYYRVSILSEWISGEKITHTDTDEEYDVTFYNLTENSSYDFCVVTVREGFGGEGDKTNIVRGNTTTCSVKTGPSPATIAVSTTVSFLVIVLAILAAVCFVQRRGTTKPSDSYIGKTEFSKQAVETEDEDQAVYTNLEKPVSILVADLEKYLWNCENSRSGNLEQQFMLLNGERQFPSHVGEKEQNKTKNRFRNMIAYDHSRVVLDTVNGDPHSDYYNANYIKNVDSEVSYIASQGPNKASVDDFWRMVWKENVRNIVMLTNLVEDGKDRCIQYWPPAVGATKQFRETNVKWESEEQYGDYSVRELHVKLGENSHTVTNWHFTAWPDKSVPDQATPLIEFARRVKTSQKTAAGHLLVHCSAGVGRTGTFIALSSLMDVVETETRIDVYGYVEQMRQDRVKMVQTAVQYKFLHECLLEVFLTGNTKIPLGSMGSFNVQAEKEKLRKQFKTLAKLDQRSQRPYAANPEQSGKSRYPEITPVDKRRPFLQTPGKTSSSNYINACFVTSYRKKDAFIATQSPLPNTVEDFWRLIHDWRCPLIVMLNQLDPVDKTCGKYWPENGSSQFGHMTVNLRDEQHVGFHVHRQFELTNTFDQEPRLVHQMELTSWGQNNQENIVNFISHMEKLQQDYSMEAPTVVHCINGVGRTGVFLTVKSEMERTGAEGNVDVFNTVRQLRRSNHSMVYTEEEYYLCHQLLKSEFPESQYANI